jgi:hypothetical protein
MLKNTSMRFGMIGGTALMSYRILIDYFRHHEEANPRPMFLDHTAAMTTIVTVSTAFVANRPYTVFVAFMLSTFLISPFSWWFMRSATMGKNRMPSNVIYQDDTTNEEIERYRHQDMIEEAAMTMQLKQGYGYVKRGDPGFF